MIATPIASVVQNSDRSTGVENFTYKIRLVLCASCDVPPKTTNPRGDFHATRFPACLVSPVCMWT